MHALGGPDHSLGAACGPFEQPIRGDPDRGDRVPRADLERAPVEPILGSSSEDPARLVPNQVNGPDSVATAAPRAAAVRAT